MQSTEHLASVLVEAVRAAPSRQLTGAQAGTIIRDKDPDFMPRQHEVSTLRQFIKRYVPALREVGRSGADLLYGLDESTKVVEQPRPSLWRIWVSPASPYILSIHRERKVVRAVPRGTAAPDELCIEPAPQEVHRRIAEQFMSQVDESTRERLAPVLANPQPDWWHAWLRSLKMHELLQKWNQHRHDLLLERLRVRLQEAGFTEGHDLDPILRQIKEPPPSLSSPRVTQQKTEGRLQSLELVPLVQAIIERMAPHELRALPLPLGLVLDALSGAKSTR